MAEKRARYQNRIELLQGTLDLLILQTCNGGRSTATASAWPFAIAPAKHSRWIRVRSIPHCTGWKAEVDQSGMEDLRE